MDKRFMILTVDMADKIEQLYYSFCLKHFKSEEDLNDVINFIISAHMSSMMNCLDDASKQYPDINLKIRALTSKFADFIAQYHPTQSVEVIKTTCSKEMH